MFFVFHIVIRGLFIVTNTRSRRARKKSTNWFLLAGVAAVFVVPSIASVLGGYLQGQEQDRYRKARLQGVYAARLKVDSRILKHVPLRPVPARYQDPKAYPATVNPAQVQLVYRLASVHVPDLFLGEGDIIAAPPLQRFDPAQVSVEPLGWIEESRLLAIREACTPTTGTLGAEDAQTFLRSWLEKPALDEQISTCVATSDKAS